METRYSPKQTAEKLGISLRTLYRYEARGLITPVHLPPAPGQLKGHRRYTEKEINRLLGEQ